MTTHPTYAEQTCQKSPAVAHKVPENADFMGKV